MPQPLSEILPVYPLVSTRRKYVSQSILFREGISTPRQQRMSTQLQILMPDFCLMRRTLLRTSRHTRRFAKLHAECPVSEGSWRPPIHDSQSIPRLCVSCLTIPMLRMSSIRKKTTRQLKSGLGRGSRLAGIPRMLDSWISLTEIGGLLR